MNIQSLENRIRNLERKVRGMVVDIDDPRYAVYKKGRYTINLEELDYKRYKLDPANKTAVNYEIEKLNSQINDQGLTEFLKHHGINPDFIEEKKEIEQLKKLPIETNKKIHVKESQYFIYKLTHKDKKTIVKAHNKAAKEYGKSAPPMKEIQLFVQIYELIKKNKKRLQELGFNSRYESQKIPQ